MVNYFSCQTQCKVKKLSEGSKLDNALIPKSACLPWYYNWRSFFIKAGFNSKVRGDVNPLFTNSLIL